MDTNRIGIDLGGTKIEGVVLDAAQVPVVRRRIPTESAGGYEHILERVALLLADLRPHAPGATAVGIGTPGSISSRDQAMKNSNTICLNGRQLQRDLERRLGMQVHLENDANCFALAEALAGAGRGGRLVFGIIIGTGVGGGIIWDGKLWRGPQSLAGEWGHHRIAADGPRCYCGQRGCVETLISGPAVERQYAESAGAAAPMAEIAARARRGERAAVEVLERFIDRFGFAVANLVNILDPDVIVLGGGLSNLDLLYDQGRDAVRRYVFNDELRTPIARNQLGDSAGVVGAALLVDTFSSRPS